MSQDEKPFTGQCFCGAVTIAVTGDPVGVIRMGTPEPVRSR